MGMDPSFCSRWTAPCTNCRRAVDRGVQVVLYNDPSTATKPNARADACKLLTEAGAAIVEVERVHTKTLCVDRSEIIEGSFNWLSRPRNEADEYAKYESSFRYTGHLAEQFIERAIEQLKLRALDSKVKSSRTDLA